MPGPGSGYWICCLLPQPKQEEDFVCFLLTGLFAFWERAFDIQQWVKSFFQVN